MSAPKTFLVVTTISKPNAVLKKLATGAAQNNIPFVIIGDSKSPADFKLKHAEFFSLQQQETFPFKLAPLTPQKHYSRKNLGYLMAIQSGAEVIIETDDDNFPMDGFWKTRQRNFEIPFVETKKWFNVYLLFSKGNIWPRGFPLEMILESSKTKHKTFSRKKIVAPIQQGLADDNPDVDAVYRLVEKLPVTFFKNKTVALGKNTWCPYNSQNTTYFKEAFHLLYLPSYCSFRMTDIWRSFVAQRIAWENNWYLLFHSPTVYQERNAHNLLHDFELEISGYLHNDKIVKTLEQLKLKKGQQHIAENLYSCYEALVNMGLIDKKELELVKAWNTDLAKLK